MHKLIERGYIPLDKSWIIRMGVLDFFNGHDDIFKFLKERNDLGKDLKSLLKALGSWGRDEFVDVGESGTLYRFLKFASWKRKERRKFILHGSLKDRKICDDPSVVNWSLEDLLKLDSETSQWASASVLFGNDERISNAPYKLKLTYNAVFHWKKQRKNGECWKPKFDETILDQAFSYYELLHEGKTIFLPSQAEDYCFARAISYMTKKAGEVDFPSLHGHESDRLEEMERQIERSCEGLDIDSKDHRVIQAIAMYQELNDKDGKILYPSCVDKSWPQFWDFLRDAPNL